MTWWYLDGTNRYCVWLDCICCKGHLLATRALNSCTPELKPDHSAPAVSFSLSPPAAITPFPPTPSPLPSFVSCCLKVIPKALWSLSKAEGDNIKFLRVCSLGQLWFQSILQPDLYMTVPWHPLAISAEELWWLLCLVQGDIVHCRVNGFPFQCGVCPNCCLYPLGCAGTSPRVGWGEGGAIEVWCFSISSHQFSAGAVTTAPLKNPALHILSLSTSKDTWLHGGKLATSVVCNAVWPGAVRWHHMVNETGSSGMCGHLLLQLGGWLAASQADY